MFVGPSSNLLDGCFNELLESCVGQHFLRDGDYVIFMTGKKAVEVNDFQIYIWSSNEQWHCS